MTWTDRIALLLCLIAVIVSALVGARVFENLPHLEDEMAYVWQAEAMAGGHLILPSPICPRCFLQPFVVDSMGMRTGKYPPGWPAMLALGVLLRGRGWVNPLLAGFTVWLIYLLVKKLTDGWTALVGAFLLVTSPFFVMNSGTLLAHPWSLFLSAAFCLGWLDTHETDRNLPRWFTGSVATLSLGVLALTRPLTAVAVALPFALHGLWLLIQGNAQSRRAVLLIGGGAALISAIYFGWQYAVTGNALSNPYQLWWPYDTIGFGANVGRQVGGYWPKDAIPNLQVSLSYGNFDLFGWPGYSWIFLPFGLLAILRKPRAILVAATLPAVVLAYCLYWIGSWLFGPRYYYEGLIGAILLTAAGIHWLAGTLLPAGAAAWRRWAQRVRLGIVAGVVMFLVSCNVIWYLPNRVLGLHGLYSVSAANLAPFRSSSAIALTPALVIVHPKEDWIEYGRLLDLSNPYLNTPFVLTISRGPELDAEVVKLFPGRSVWHYYPDRPLLFYDKALYAP